MGVAREAGPDDGIGHEPVGWWAVLPANHTGLAGGAAMSRSRYLLGRLTFVVVAAYSLLSVTFFFVAYTPDPTRRSWPTPPRPVWRYRDRP